ncbi:MAG: Sphingolipid C9-methyltransferase 2 [Phylliscum demangeonii]|nr:MAG: Sphingolipid C9-methyltransferase 2 [Phylliscum demangeonii]
MSQARSSSSEDGSFDFIETPAAATPVAQIGHCGVRTTSFPSIKNAPLPAEGAGSDSFSNAVLFVLLAFIPLYMTWQLGGGLITWVFMTAVSAIPILMVFWTLASSISPRRTEQARLPGLPVEHYLHFAAEADRVRYRGRAKIPMDTFHDMYFDGAVDFKGDALDVLEYRHDWASFRFTWNLFRFFLTGMLPEVVMHTRSQDEEQVRDHYDRGDDFYSWFLGPRMVYTSGIISNIHREETLEQLQDNKLAIVCEKIGLRPGDRMLDIGCGWGTLARYASVEYGAEVTGVTLGRNQTAWGNTSLRKAGVGESQSRILCMDYRDIPPAAAKRTTRTRLDMPDEGATAGGYDKITCLEMAEHVGLRHFGAFLNQVYELLSDEQGVFFLQVAGLRRSWQYEDLIWGLFMNRYIFPGADASTPLAWFVGQLEQAGFEIKAVDTIGVHYSATLWRWYRNWQANRAKVVAGYGLRWFRIWEFFLAYSTIIARQGSATCYQIVCVKNVNATHRVEGVPTQFGLQAALRAAQLKKRTGRADEDEGDAVLPAAAPGTKPSRDLDPDQLPVPGDLLAVS